MNLEELWNKYEDDYLEFGRIENKRSQRPDLHAFLLLDELLPGARDIVSAAEHDEFWLDIDCDKLKECASEDQVLELIRCGVNYDSDLDSLGMFA